MNRRADALRSVAEFIVDSFTLAIIIAVVYSIVWGGCALSDVCYNANV